MEDAPPEVLSSGRCEQRQTKPQNLGGEITFGTNCASWNDHVLLDRINWLRLVFWRIIVKQQRLYDQGQHDQKADGEDVVHEPARIFMERQHQMPLPTVETYVISTASQIYCKNFGGISGMLTKRHGKSTVYLTIVASGGTR